MSNYSDYIWSAVLGATGNEYGTAALMGNLQAESGLIPYRLQGDFTAGYTKSVAYTNKVNSGEYSRNEFIHDAKGYGLAQWTFYSRKANLYDAWQNGGYESIGSIELACSFLISELQSSYPTVWSAIINATDIRTPSNSVLHDFENPQSQGEDVEIYRESLGTAIYIQYHGTPPTPPPPVPPTPTGAVPLWMLFKFRHIDFFCPSMHNKEGTAQNAMDRMRRHMASLVSYQGLFLIKRWRLEHEFK